MPHSSSSQPTPDDVLTYWLGDGLHNDWPSADLKERWFGGGKALDADITQRFGALVETALNGGLTEWASAQPVRLALILVLDQFTRNVHRGEGRAFAGDERAQQLVLKSLALGHDEKLARVGRVFLYMPLMHAENLALQQECVRRFEDLVQHSPPALKQSLAGNLKFAREHRDIIERFGRFPYRNAALGRESTPEELEFLKDGPRFGQ